MSPLILADVEQMAIPTNDILGCAGNCALEQLVIVWIRRNDVEYFFWLDEDPKFESFRQAFTGRLDQRVCYHVWTARRGNG